MKVFIIESESGWGRRVVETKDFETREEAETFVREYNRKYNPPGQTPDWYMFATLEDRNLALGMMR